ncbi:helix-turn-helix domain-containing protein [Rhodococcus sp. 2G]|uniref:helix-turn-helix domain-containing protein n=1 Tax=Rhodococcus TaxID=1827 RepID=UPI0018DB18C5|nr:ImmA/IrrE family metallo-endopeptidase [Rhodococcus sp. 2G]
MSSSWSAHHGERVTDLRRLLSLTQGELSERSGIPQPNLSMIERGKRELTVESAYRIARATGTPLEFFGFKSATYSAEEINFRKSSKTSARGREYAVQAFKEIERISISLEKAPVRIKNTDIPVAEEADIVSDNDIEAFALDARRCAGLADDEPVRNVIRTIERTGAAVAPLAVSVEDPALLDGHSGLSRWDESAARATVAFISGQPGDRQRFTLAHEFGHVVLHTRRNLPLELRETEANLFAGAFLLPRTVAIENLSETLTLHGYMRIKSRYGISVQAAISRAKRLGIISAQRYKSLMIQISSRGWRKAEPVEVGIEKPARLWTELTATYGPKPYFPASPDLGVAPVFLEQWIPAREGRAAGRTTTPTDSNVVSFAARGRQS